MNERSFHQLRTKGNPKNEKTLSGHPEPVKNFLSLRGMVKVPSPPSGEG